MAARVRNLLKYKFSLSEFSVPDSTESEQTKSPLEYVFEPKSNRQVFQNKGQEIQKVLALFFKGIKNLQRPAFKYFDFKDSTLTVVNKISSQKHQFNEASGVPLKYLLILEDLEIKSPTVSRIRSQTSFMQGLLESLVEFYNRLFGDVIKGHPPKPRLLLTNINEEGLFKLSKEDLNKMVRKYSFSSVGKHKIKRIQRNEDKIFQKIEERVFARFHPIETRLKPHEKIPFRHIHFYIGDMISTFYQKISFQTYSHQESEELRTFFNDYLKVSKCLYI